MESIRNVELEVDKVLRLFSNCKEVCNKNLDILIEQVERAKKALESSNDGRYYASR